MLSLEWSFTHMAQPNFATMHQCLLGLINEAALLPNLPAVNQQQLAGQVRNCFSRMPK